MSASPKRATVNEGPRLTHNEHGHQAGRPSPGPRRKEPTMGRIDAIDLFNSRLGALSAQAQLLACGGFDPFYRLADGYRADYFSAMLGELDDCISLLSCELAADDREGVLVRRLRAVHAQCVLMTADGIDGNDRLGMEGLANLTAGMADTLAFCCGLALLIPPDLRPAVAKAA